MGLPISQHRIVSMTKIWIATVAALLLARAALALDFPGPAPGRPRAAERNGCFTLENDVLAVSWHVEKGQVLTERIENKLSGQTHRDLAAPLIRFRYRLLGQPNAILESDATKMAVTRPLAIRAIHGDRKAVRVGDRLDGQSVTASLRDPKTGITVDWRAELRDGSNYVRSFFTFNGGNAPVELLRIWPLVRHEEGGAQVGCTQAVPVLVKQTFFAVELPFGGSWVSPNEVQVWADADLPLSAGVSQTISAVVGAAPAGQARRAFLYYIERERARPCKPFLHYNCWFDLGYSADEEKFLANVKTFTEEMTTKRGVTMDGFVLDDGWDDFQNGFWAADKHKFPRGFEGLAQQLDRLHHAHLGIWISPLGGYARSNDRIAHARKMGMTTRRGERPYDDYLDLSQPKYYAWFRDFCANMVTNNKLNYFKWDRAGFGAAPHFMALLRCAAELRKLNPDLFVNVTAGTWPSPFWLQVIDCTWRDGDDMNYLGKGDDREKWINFRDATTYQKVVKGCPFYPLNSIMVHGIIVSRDGMPDRAYKAGTNLVHEARSYFGSGTALQELYIAPKLMTPEAWNTLAAAAKWARRNADVLVDTHWVGGDPAKDEIYGWASWSPRKGILTLRNPDDKPAQLSLDIGKVFELPADACKEYVLTSPYRDQRVQKATLSAGTPHVFTLEPFEVLVLESSPTTYGK
jgi:hypothetical protein